MDPHWCLTIKARCRGGQGASTGSSAQEGVHSPLCDAAALSLWKVRKWNSRRASGGPSFRREEHAPVEDTIGPESLKVPVSSGQVADSRDWNSSSELLYRGSCHFCSPFCLMTCVYLYAFYLVCRFCHIKASTILHFCILGNGN